MSLEAVRDSALAAAGDEAAAIRRGAAARAERIRADAHRQATALIDERRATAARLAEREERERLADARASATAAVLRAQQRARRDAICAAREAARGLTGDPRYEQLVDRLAGDARQRLQAVGPVQVSPAAGGGVVARAGSRQIDYSLDAQLDRVVRSLAGELAALWR